MHDTIALIFDFDDTLAPDSTSAFLQEHGIPDIRRFWDHEVHELILEDWDPVPAYLYLMIQKSRNGEIPAITRAMLRDWGARLPLYDGVETLFGRLRDAAARVDKTIKLEFYLISSGIGDIIRHTPVARRFDDIWTSEFEYDGEERILFPKKVISFTDKTRYVFQIQKGLVGRKYRGQPFLVNEKHEQPRIPFENMVVIGDGYTDIPCFSLIRRFGGKAFGVYQRGKQGRAWGFMDDERTHANHRAEYGEDSELYDTLKITVEQLTKNCSEHK